MSQALAEMLPPALDEVAGAPVTPDPEPLALAAWLEANGINDQVAQRYGAEDVFALAAGLPHAPHHPVWQIIARPQPGAPVGTPRRAHPQPDWRLLLYGPLLAVLMIVGLIELGWWWELLRQAGVPAAAFLQGLIVGSVIGGAALQALSWRSGMALSQQATHVLQPLLRFHLCGVVLAWLLGACLALLWPHPNGVTLGLLGAAGVVLGLVLLSGCLVILRRAVWAVLGLGLPFGLTCVLLALLPGMRPAQAAWSCWLLQIGILLVGLLRPAWPTPGGQPRLAVLPAPRATLFGALPYLISGALPPLGVGLAQLTAWTSLQRGVAPGTVLYTAHWLGMLSVALAQGMGEHAIRSFWPALQQPAAASLRRHMARALLWRLCGVAVALLISGLLTLGTCAALIRIWPGLADQLPLTGLLPVVGLLSYACFGLGLFACLVPIALARPGLAGLALGAAIGVQLVVTLWYEPRLPSGGLLGLGVSGVTLLTMALGGWLRLIRHAEYTLYRAF